MPGHLSLQLFQTGPCEIDVRIEFQSDPVEPDGFLLVAQFSQVGSDIGVIYCRAWIQLYNPFKRSDRFIVFLQFEIAEPSQVVDFFEFGVGLFGKTRAHPELLRIFPTP